MYRKKATTGRRSLGNTTTTTTTITTGITIGNTRAVRTASKRRRLDGRGGGDGGLKQRFEQAAERPAKKWVLVYRKPSTNVSFMIKTWVPYSKLTQEERDQHDGISTTTTVDIDKDDQRVGDEVVQPNPVNTTIATTTMEEDVTNLPSQSAVTDELFPLPSDFLFSGPIDDGFITEPSTDMVLVAAAAAAAAAAAGSGVGTTTSGGGGRDTMLSSNNPGKGTMVESTELEFPTFGDEDILPSTKRSRIEGGVAGYTPGVYSTNVSNQQQQQQHPPSNPSTSSSWGWDVP